MTKNGLLANNMTKKALFIVVGVVAAATLVTSLSSYSMKVIRVAKAYLGNKEIKPNKGFTSQNFTDEMKKSGWWVGAPWCMFFAKLVFLKSMTGEKLSAVKKYFTGSTISTFNNVDSGLAKPFRTSMNAKKGSIVIWEGINDKTKGHAGIVIEVNGNNFTTIEGNWGDEVIVKKRSYSDIVNNCKLKGFIV